MLQLVWKSEAASLINNEASNLSPCPYLNQRILKLESRPIFLNTAIALKKSNQKIFPSHTPLHFKELISFQKRLLQKSWCPVACDGEAGVLVDSITTDLKWR